MHKVVIAPAIHQKGIDLLDARPDVRYTVVDDVSEGSLKRAFEGIDGAVVRAIVVNRAVMSAAPGLKVLSRHGVGYNTVDVDHLNERRIPLTLTVNANAVSVAEQTLFFLLALARNGLVYDRATRNADFKYRESLNSNDIAGKTLVIIGFGRIGRAVAERARACAMRIVVFDPLLSAALVPEAGYATAATLDEALAIADYVSVHIPMTSGTKGLIGEREIALMRPSASIINTARGGIVDEQALIVALREKRLRGAALDVFEEEPPAPDHPLFSLDNVVLSPHSAGLTVECAERMAIDSVTNLLAAFDGTLDPGVVANRDAIGFPSAQ